MLLPGEVSFKFAYQYKVFLPFHQLYQCRLFLTSALLAYSSFSFLWSSVVKKIEMHSLHLSKVIFVGVRDN